MNHNLYQRALKVKPDENTVKLRESVLRIHYDYRTRALRQIRVKLFNGGHDMYTCLALLPNLIYFLVVWENKTAHTKTKQEQRRKKKKTKKNATAATSAETLLISKSQYLTWW